MPFFSLFYPNLSCMCTFCILFLIFELDVTLNILDICFQAPFIFTWSGRKVLPRIGNTFREHDCYKFSANVTTIFLILYFLILNIVEIIAIVSKPNIFVLIDFLIKKELCKQIKNPLKSLSAFAISGPANWDWVCGTMNIERFGDLRTFEFILKPPS